MIIFVPNKSISKRDELIAQVRVRPELFVTTSHYLALIAADKIDEWVLFDHPYGVLKLEQDEPYVHLLDLEEGVERVVMREHLELAMMLQIILKAF